MSRSIDEMIEAATIIEEELIGGDGTRTEIEGAVEKACPAWAKDDKEAALMLAAHMMYRSGDEGWETARISSSRSTSSTSRATSGATWGGSAR